jgi:hypothetical protein
MRVPTGVGLGEGVGEVMGEGGGRTKISIRLNARDSSSVLLSVTVGFDVFVIVAGRGRRRGLAWLFLDFGHCCPRLT